MYLHRNAHLMRGPFRFSIWIEVVGRRMSDSNSILFEDIFEVNEVNLKGKSSTQFKNGKSVEEIVSLYSFL